MCGVTLLLSPGTLQCDKKLGRGSEGEQTDQHSKLHCKDEENYAVVLDRTPDTMHNTTDLT